MTGVNSFWVISRVEIRTFVVIAHSRIVVLDNLDERSHDLREENDTNKHEQDSYKHLVP